MMGSEKFCLRWNDFESNISTAFRELREDKDFFDVTIACDEDQIQAHKVILSACSPFFRSVLRRNRHDHPLLYLKGVKYVDIVSVLNFMYHGEVNVAQDELNSFLAVAEDLKVKGLTQNSSDKSPKVQHPLPSQTLKPKAQEPPERQNLHPPLPPKRPRASPLPPVSVPIESKYLPVGHEEDDEIQEVVPIKSEPGSIPVCQDGAGVVADPNLDNSIYGDEYADYSNYEADQSYDGGTLAEHNLTANLDGTKGSGCNQYMSRIETEPNKCSWSCHLCSKVLVSKANMEDHIRGTHLGARTDYNCQICGKTFGSRNSLSGHMSRHHKNEYI